MFKKLLLIAIFSMIAFFSVSCDNTQLPPKQAMKIQVTSVQNKRITLKWNTPFTTDMLLDWKQKNNDDTFWPNDFFYGGQMKFADNSVDFTYDGISNQAYAFRLRNIKTGEVSNTVHVINSN
jgi:hypothetical protein